MFNVFDVLKEVVGKVQRNNKENPNVETAPENVFDKIKDKIEDMKENRQDRKEQNAATGGGIGDFLERMKKGVQEVKETNEANPDEATADPSVFNELEMQMKKLQEENERLKNQASNASNASEVVYTEVPAQESNIPSTPTPTPPTNSDAVGELAMTNSKGGSLGVRAEPDFGAQSVQLRVPDNSYVRVVKYSDHKINLDGQDSRWALIDFEGTRGWIPEIYLNFN